LITLKYKFYENLTKTAIIILSLIIFTISCCQTSQAANIQGPDIKFVVTEHDFGTINKGADGSFGFVFSNGGTEPLVLSNVRSSCGCVAVQWPKELIRAGGSSVIRVRYDTQRIGSFNKSITVYSNAGEVPVVIRIKGTVNDNPWPWTKI